ncbi:MAG: peptidase C11 [Clostridia bacterium]|nr:peptidase C11 [Clostridia bacterium]
MDQTPRGREKNVTGQGKPIQKRGDGLGTGPVGRSDGYQSRPANGSGSGGPQRSGGRGKIGIIAILAALLLGGGGFGLSSLFGGGSDQPATSNLNSLFSGFTNSSVSSGWITDANTGKLNKNVADGAREKYTAIFGGGQDRATVMVYMCGTDLESKSGMASNDLKEMATATLNKNVNVIVYTGGCKQWKTSGISNSVNQIYKIENGKMTCLVKDDGRDPMTKPATLTRFIQYCTENYPANRNMLILWDHGAGSISGYGYDEKNVTAGSMTLKGINDALRDSKTTFDFIGFDACLMATLENALMLDKYADYLIASEETEPGVGWYYTNWLTTLANNPATPTLDLGKQIVDDFVGYCNQRCPGQKTTLSVVDLADLTATVPATFSNFAKETAETIQSKNYKTVSDARAKTREFATSNKIDQIDLVHLAYNIGTDDAKAMADSLLGAVKYNKTSSSINNAYGLAIYFPYQKTSKVKSALSTYQAIGMDSDYAECVRAFAGLEIAGQAVSTGTGSAPASPMPSLFGNYTGQSTASGDLVSTLLGSLLGGGTTGTASSGGSFNLSGLGDLTSLAGTLLGGSGLTADRASEIITDNQLDTSNFVWTKQGDDYVMALTEAQWKQIHSLQLNVFFDDGEGYIDLGLDNVYRIKEDGTLVNDFDGTWLAIDNQPVPYYYIDTIEDGANYTITGRVPVLLNGERANLILIFDTANPYGYIAGARYEYLNGETETVAKGTEGLTEGDKIEFVCDYYTYDGVYQDSYLLGDPMTYTGKHTISNVEIEADKCSATYLITDSYNQEYWTPAVPQD